MPPDLIHALRCPECGGPVHIVAAGEARWYCCKWHGAVEPVPFTSSASLTAGGYAGGIFSRLREPGRASL